MNAMEIERESLIAAGMKEVSLTQYAADILAMGFKLDRSMDCHCMARDMATGRTFPAITSCARQIETGAGFANTTCNRDAAGWTQFMAYRREHFAIVRGKVFTV